MVRGRCNLCGHCFSLLCYKEKQTLPLNGTAIMIAFMVGFVIFVNMHFDTLSTLSMLPLVGFSLYRYAELGCGDVKFRVYSIAAGSLYFIYSASIASYGVFISEMSYIFVHIYHLSKMRNKSKNCATL